MFHGFYINLDSRSDRRAHMERELARYGLAAEYRRLPAEADRDPPTGCYRSHLKALDAAARLDGIVHILEDDSQLSDHLLPFLQSDDVHTLLGAYDIVFLDMWIDPEPAVVQRWQAALAARTGYMDLKGTRIGAMSSYIVAPRSYAKVRRVWLAGMNGRNAIDSACNSAVASGELTAAVTLPFITGVDPGVGIVSDIQAIPAEAQRLLLLLRSRFFVGAPRQ